VLNKNIIDEIVKVSNDNAGITARRLAREEGIPGWNFQRCGAFGQHLKLPAGRKMWGNLSWLLFLTPVNAISPPGFLRSNRIYKFEFMLHTIEIREMLRKEKNKLLQDNQDESEKI